MTMDELTSREARDWAELRAAVDRLASEQLSTGAVNEDGWTTKDVLWHIAHWWDHLAGMLDAMGAGTFEEPPEDDAATDAENAVVLAESRGMDLRAVEDGIAATRERLLSAWAALPELTGPAERWFVWETIEHYEEHLPGISALEGGDAP
jgi:hypothetical protein